MDVPVAGDDRVVREALVRAMSHEGYDVAGVSNGAQALEYLGGHRVDLMVFDVSMPFVDGPTVCRVARSEGNWRSRTAGSRRTRPRRSWRVLKTGSPIG